MEILRAQCVLVVKPGNYRVMLDHYRTVRMFKCQKVELIFSIVRSVTPIVEYQGSST